MYHLINLNSEIEVSGTGSADIALYLTNSLPEIVALLRRQLLFFGDLTSYDEVLIQETLFPCLRKLARCFKKIITKLYQHEGTPLFNPLHSGQYCCFLAFLRDAIQMHPNSECLADKLYFLNKMLNNIDLYSAKMPDYIFFEHPVGTVLGRACIGDYCFINQGVTLGGCINKEDGSCAYPVLHEHVILFSHAQVFGGATIGKFSVIAMNTTVIEENIPPHSLVFGSSPHLIIKPLSINRFRQLSPFYIL